MSKPECPVPECGFNANMRGLEAAQKLPLVLRSTRSHKSEDAWRDMDHFDENEELARLRRAIHEVRQMNPEGFRRHHEWKIDPSFIAKAPALLAFIAEAFDNIDFQIQHEGPLPRAWHGSSTVQDLMPRSREDIEQEASDIASGKLQFKDGMLCAKDETPASV